MFCKRIIHSVTSQNFPKNYVCVSREKKCYLFRKFGDRTKSMIQWASRPDLNCIFKSTIFCMRFFTFCFSLYLSVTVLNVSTYRVFSGPYLDTFQAVFICYNFWVESISAPRHHCWHWASLRHFVDNHLDKG